VTQTKYKYSMIFPSPSCAFPSRPADCPKGDFSGTNEDGVPGTLRVLRWMNLFEKVNGHDIVYKWFDYLKKRGHFICGYVIMPNHVHALIGFMKTNQAISTIVGNGKRFMAYEIVNRLIKQKEKQTISQLEGGVNYTDRKRGKLHQVFEPSFEMKECFSDWFIAQKLNYIHNNPCSKKWNVSASAYDYTHSSALYYANGSIGSYIVTNVGVLKDVNLHCRQSPMGDSAGT